jgi:hypothetical protein
LYRHALKLQTASQEASGTWDHPIDARSEPLLEDARGALLSQREETNVL